MGIRFDNYNKQRTATNKQAASTMSQLEVLMLQAINQQAYFHKDPDGIFTDADDKALITKSAAALIPSWNVNLERVNDIVAVMQGQLSVDELMSKYNVDLDTYRLELE